jgi:hypothetical protein
LFEEEGNAGIEALVAYFNDPIAKNWSCARAGLTTYDYPIDAIKIEVGDWA